MYRVRRDFFCETTPSPPHKREGFKGSGTCIQTDRPGACRESTTICGPPLARNRKRVLAHRASMKGVRFRHGSHACITSAIFAGSPLGAHQFRSTAAYARYSHLECPQVPVRQGQRAWACEADGAGMHARCTPRRVRGCGRACAPCCARFVGAERGPAWRGSHPGGSRQPQADRGPFHCGARVCARVVPLSRAYFCGDDSQASVMLFWYTNRRRPTFRALTSLSTTIRTGTDLSKISYSTLSARRRKPWSSLWRAGRRVCRSPQN